MFATRLQYKNVNAMCDVAGMMVAIYAMCFDENKHSKRLNLKTVEALSVIFNEISSCNLKNFNFKPIFELVRTVR